MNLTYAQIEKIATGFIYSNVTEKGIEFYRFSKTQEEQFFKGIKYFNTEKEPFFIGYFGRNCRTNSGTTLDFYTDAKSVKICVGENERPNDVPNFTYQIYVNGKFGVSGDADKDLYLKLGSRKTRRRVTVYLTHFNFTTIKGVELEDGTYAEPAGSGVDVLCLGDSITHGWSALMTSNTWVNTMARKLNLRVLNQANSGYVFDEKVLERVCDPKVIAVAYGINDQGRKNREELEKDARDYVLKLKKLYPEAKILGIVPIWTTPEKEKENVAFTGGTRAILKRVYEDCGAIAVDGLKMVPNNEKYFADAVHPNEAGEIFYGQRMAKVIAQVLKSN